MTVEEQAARVIAAQTHRSQHSQLCPVWLKRPGKKSFDSTLRLLEDLGRCDCWIMSDARQTARVLSEEHLLATPAEEPTL